MAVDNWYETVSIPALLRHARRSYGTTMRKALEGAGYDDLPGNGLYVIGALALGERHVQLASVIEDIGLSKQAAGQLVDTMVARGYLERRTDPQDRRRLILSLTERGEDAARVQTLAREGIDRALAGRAGSTGVLALRKVLAALIGLGTDVERSEEPAAPTLWLREARPVLLVRDVDRTARFFAGKLGFTTDFLHGEPAFYGSVSRDRARLHLRCVGNPNFADLAEQEDSLIVALIEVSDVHALHAECRAQGVEVAQDPVEQVWGGTDFHIRDPDGNRIAFVQYSTAKAAVGGSR